MYDWPTMDGGIILPKTHSDSAQRLTVESVDNHVYFYAEVDPDRCLALIRTLRDVDARIRNESLSRGLNSEQIATAPIWLHIQSGGGSLFSAFALADQLKSIRTSVISVVEGYAASAATIISAACSRRVILPHSFMLIHQLSDIAWGKYDAIKDQTHMMDMAMAQLVAFYAEHTKMSQSKIEALLTHDSWFNAAECVKLGLADKILV